MKKRQLQFRIHDPNPQKITAAFLERLFVQISADKLKSELIKSLDPHKNEQKHEINRAITEGGKNR